LFFHLPSLTLSRGHFYLAQTGHYHVAATRACLDRVDNQLDELIYQAFPQTKAS
jgi:hypothetical protein